MNEAHVDSMLAVAEPFASTEPYDFTEQRITSRVRELVPTMLRLRQRPPPNETYSLNRKLSGMFLLCAHLGSRVDCAGLLNDVLSSRSDRLSRAFAT